MSAPISPSDALIRRGRCHLLPDAVTLDDGIIPQRFAAQRITEARELIPHLFESVDPQLAARLQPGDILLAGTQFACGKPRVQGFIAMGALNLAVVCRSMPYKMLRRAVARAIPVMTGAPAPASLATDGDELEIDYATGTLRNLSRGTQAALPPMPAILRSIVAAGGMQATLKAWLTEHPEQAA